VEEGIAAIWRELLGLERVGRNDHFFELGGHSLTFTKLSFRLKECFGVEMKVAQLYESQILKDMAAGMEMQLRKAKQARGKERTVLLDL
jgi:acyl carrier protein